MALPAQDDGSIGPVENIFEAAIKAAIEAKGWELRTQIGVSGFRIDPGVVHPDHAGVYLAGIECDGATYHGSATARGRDKVRQAVLENLGWTILRIWSTDWFRNPAAVVERIHTALKEHLDADRAKRAEEDAAREAMLADDTDEIEVSHEVEEAEVAEVERPIVEVGVEGDIAASGPVRQEAQFARAAPSAAMPEGGETGSSEASFDPERFYDADYIPALERLIAGVVEREGPMPIALLGKRVSGMHG